MCVYLSCIDSNYLIMKFIVNILFVISFLCFLCEIKSFKHFGIGIGLMRLANKQSQIVIDDDNNCKTKWIDQPVDHFNKSLNVTWCMKYYENLKFFVPGAPLYFFVGGIGETESQHSLMSGLMFDLAKQTKGAMFATEHRYYGQRLPHQNLQYLNSRQALADVARLIKFKKAFTKYNNSKVVAFGRNYGGNLAVWLKEMFPTKVDAVVADGAPLLAKVDFDQFLPQVAKNMKEFAPHHHWNKVIEDFKMLDFKLNYSYGIELIKKEENICNQTDMWAPENQQFLALMQFVSFLADYTHDISEVHNISKVTSFMFKQENFPLTCVSVDFVSFMKDIKENLVMRPTLYQYYQFCTEFGHFLTTTSDEHPFPKRLPVDLNYLMCYILFGHRFNQIHKGVKYTNFVFGGKEPNVTKVIFVYGDLDPAKHLGVVKNRSPAAPVLIIPNITEPSILFHSEHEPLALLNARKEIKHLIKKWLNYTRRA